MVELLAGAALLMLARKMGRPSACSTMAPNRESVQTKKIGLVDIVPAFQQKA